MAIQPIPPFAAQPQARALSPAAPVREPEKVEQTSAVPAQDAKSAVQDTPQTAAEPSTTAPSRAQIDQAMNEVKRALAPVARNLQFSVDDETGRTVIKVIDSTTNEVIRQMPSEELLAITKAMDSFSGLFVKQKA